MMWCLTWITEWSNFLLKKFYIVIYTYYVVMPKKNKVAVEEGAVEGEHPVEAVPDFPKDQQEAAPKKKNPFKPYSSLTDEEKAARKQKAAETRRKNKEKALATLNELEALRKLANSGIQQDHAEKKIAKTKTAPAVEIPVAAEEDEDEDEDEEPVPTTSGSTANGSTASVSEVAPEVKPAKRAPVRKNRREKAQSEQSGIPKKQVPSFTGKNPYSSIIG